MWSAVPSANAVDKSLLGLVASTNDISEGVLERSTTNEETINIGLLDKFASVLVGDTTSIHDAGLNCCLVGDISLEPATDGVVGLLGLVWGSDNTSANSPNWLVSDDNLAPVLDLFADSSELSSVDGIGVAGLTLVKLLTNAGHDAEVVVEGHLDLAGDNLVTLTEDVTTFTVSEDDPVESGILEHSSGGLSGVGTIAVKRAVLSTDLDI